MMILCEGYKQDPVSCRLFELHFVLEERESTAK